MFVDYHSKDMIGLQAEQEVLSELVKYVSILIAAGIKP